MTIKDKITSKFNKNEFQINNGGRDIHVEDNDWEGIDEYIRSFVQDLNKCKDISTLYTCEGHVDGDSAYLFFNVNERGWDILWNKVIPELSYKFTFVDKNLHKTALYSLMWNISTSSEEDSKDITTGININTTLQSFMSITWEDKKDRFWNTISETFLKYYN